MYSYRPFLAAIVISSNHKNPDTGVDSTLIVTLRPRSDLKSPFLISQMDVLSNTQPGVFVPPTLFSTLCSCVLLGPARDSFLWLLIF